MAPCEASKRRHPQSCAPALSIGLKSSKSQLIAYHTSLGMSEGTHDPIDGANDVWHQIICHHSDLGKRLWAQLSTHELA
eukprot:5991261-Amphidinium_carterae.2